MDHGRIWYAHQQYRSRAGYAALSELNLILQARL